jgi:PEP-CTERM motif
MYNKPWLPVWACITICVGLPSTAAAADATFTTEAAFVAAAGSTRLESFETVAPLVRGNAPVVAPLFSVTGLTAPIGVQSAANTPNDGFGASATDGTRYLTAYLPNQPQGTLRFDLASPSTVFGFNIMDVGEVTGTVSIRTNSGAFSSDTLLASYPPILINGNVQFFGLTQNLPFTQVFVTVTGNDDAFGIDKVSVSVVPEPATALLLLGGLIALRRFRS